MNTRNNSRRRFLEALFSDYFAECRGYIEIRLFPAPGRVKRYFFSSIDKLSNIPFERINTHFGVCPRSTKRGTEEAIRHITTFWADIDIGKERNSLSSVGEAIRNTNRFRFQPSIIVYTGGGLHLYWLLKEPEEAISLHRDIINGLGQALGGDPVHDLARIMRLPETLNMKYSRPRKVNIVNFNPNIRYNPLDLEEIAVPVQLVAPLAAIEDRSAPPVNIMRLAIPDRVKRLIVEGDNEKLYPSRSERDQAVINHLVRINCSPAIIQSIFANPDYAVSDKYMEKGRQGNKYLALTIGKAKASQQDCYAW